MSTRSKKIKTENDSKSTNNEKKNMSLIEHKFFPRSMFDYDTWNRPLSAAFEPLTTLDLFDPFDDLDNVLARNMAWINQPDFLRQVAVPRVPHKYRVTADCFGYKPDAIKTEILDGKLVVSGKEGDAGRDEHSDYSFKEFKRTYTLPNNLETDKMVSFITKDGKLVVEIPFKEEKKESLFPSVAEDKDGKKRVTMNFDLPKNVDPSKLKVTCKDRDLIVQAEDKVAKEDGESQFYYYRRCTFPENTDFDALKCTLENNKLAIEAPINANFKPHNRSIAVESRPQIQGAPANGH